MLWELPALWKPPPPSWHYGRTSFRPPPTSPFPIPNATSMCSPPSPAQLRLAISSTKSMHGHALGAAGALEAAATIMALRENLIPPTANFTVPDPECDLDVVPNVARPASVEWALSNSFAFGGLNAVLAFHRPF